MASLRRIGPMVFVVVLVHSIEGISSPSSWSGVVFVAPGFETAGFDQNVSYGASSNSEAGATGASDLKSAQVPDESNNVNNAVDNPIVDASIFLPASEWVSVRLEEGIFAWRLRIENERDEQNISGPMGLWFDRAGQELWVFENGDDLTDSIVQLVVRYDGWFDWQRLLSGQGDLLDLWREGDVVASRPGRWREVPLEDFGIFELKVGTLGDVGSPERGSEDDGDDCIITGIVDRIPPPGGGMEPEWERFWDGLVSIRSDACCGNEPPESCPCECPWECCAPNPWLDEFVRCCEGTCYNGYRCCTAYYCGNGLCCNGPCCAGAPLRCCPSGTKCCLGRFCCPPTSICCENPDHCCPPDGVCCGNGCCGEPAPQCCSTGNCCAATDTCCPQEPDGCCTSEEQCCGANGCCEEPEYCCPNDARCCPDEWECCPNDSAADCCDPKFYYCDVTHCCPHGKEACPDGVHCCDAEEDCCEGSPTSCCGEDEFCCPDQTHCCEDGETCCGASECCEIGVEECKMQGDVEKCCPSGAILCSGGDTCCDPDLCCEDLCCDSTAAARGAACCGANLALTSIVPSGVFVLGNDLTINYEVSKCNGFDEVDLEIRNASGALVFSLQGLPGAPGAHSTVWPKGKWNQAPHIGAFANPKNNPYQVKLIGKKVGCPDREATGTVSTKLELEADIRDEVPTGATASRSAGLQDMLDALKIVMKLGPTETVLSGSGTVTVTGPTPLMRHIKVDSPSLNALPDGQYEVLFRDLRDEIGNFTDSDGNPANGIQPVTFILELW